MPPTMTSSSRSALEVSNSGSGSVLNGTIPRREPLRRLYPLQRPRSQSETLDVSLVSDENIPTAVIFFDSCKPRPMKSPAPIGPVSPALVASTLMDKLLQHLDPTDRVTERQVLTRLSPVRHDSDSESVSSRRPDGDLARRNRPKGSILKRATGRRDRCPGVPKKVKFSPNVSVVRLDECGEHLGTHLQKLCGEKRRHFGTLTRNVRTPETVIYVRDVTEGKDQARPLLASTGANRESKAITELFKRIGGIGADRGDENMPVKRGQFNITFSRCPNDGTKLRFTLYMGPEYNPNDLVVKANTTGSRIRVMATKIDRFTNSQRVDEFNERYVLPMDINPYRIEARLDKWGLLTVVAPLMTTTDRQDVHRAVTALRGVYV